MPDPRGSHPGRWVQRTVALSMAVFLLSASVGQLSESTSRSSAADYPKSGTYEDFIDAVWIFESSIDPKKQDYYNQNWNNPVVESYPWVAYPGGVMRDWDTGDPIQLYDLTIKFYFDRIGIGNLYNPSDPNPPWKSIQAAVVNYLGFVGFQFQESDLNDLGYYNFTQYYYQGQYYPSHYVDVDNSHWIHGNHGFLDTNRQEVSTPTWVTDTVTFLDENFTGKNGINSYHDFVNPDLHILVIKDHFANKYEGIVSGLKAQGKDLSDYLGTTLYWNGLKPPVSPPPGGRSNAVEVTMSGLLAGAHLRGAEGVIELLVDHENPQDENGTYILQYVQDYAGYDTPFPPE